MNFHLEKTAEGSRARAARFRTAHNEVLTPLFMPVGTIATVRAQKTETLHDAGSQILLANTYHLIQRPGLDVLESFGGIHDFMKWDRSVLTDSGGYQIFSLPKLREMKEEGAWFRSPLDGRKIELSPEASIAAQKSIGSDIMMVLDECIDSTSPKERAAAAMERTHRWARRSLEARGDHKAALFGIVQGACFEDLRRESAETLRELPFDGMAIGGLAVGEERGERERIVEATTPYMPENLPRYLMGVGTPIDLLEAVHRGVDMFDCILPTAFAQQSMAFTSNGRLILRRGIYRMQKGPIDPNCDCPTCAKYDRAYVHHLIKSREVLGWNLIGQHNLYFYHRMMREMRAEILTGDFAAYYRRWRDVLPADDLENPVKRPKPPKARKEFPRELGDYRVLENPKGFSSIQQISSGEVMHSVSDPADEAKRLYVDQLDLPALLARARERGTPLVVWDVGMGAGTNAMAFLRAVEAVSGDAPAAELILRIESFERDLDSFRLALLHPYRFRYLQHPGPFAIGREGKWTSPDGRFAWTLYEGDFQARLASAAAPDVILFDPFSAKVDSPLWQTEVFRTLRRVADEKHCELFTYSNSNLVRGRLLAAGWYVARGAGTGPKTETTIAASRPLSARPWLDRSWLGTWAKSGVRTPEVAAELDAPIAAHPQFV
ncbi:MAG: tRNA guanosine(34) transglycosylase Tgt [Bdellovibrionales bacterium]|nr:tRNA guanosine(34) transglycosylase Tgt [Bdellovibrionales bacterium]